MSLFWDGKVYRARAKSGGRQISECRVNLLTRLENWNITVMRTEQSAKPTERSNQAPCVDVIIVGAGLSGIGAAWRLRQRLPELDFLILESRDAIGGTWDLFRYPGVRSDSDMHSFSYPFRPWTKPNIFASGEEIRAYISSTAAEHGVKEHIRFRCRVASASWSSGSATWTVEAQTDEGDTC